MLMLIFPEDHLSAAFVVEEAILMITLLIALIKELFQVIPKLQESMAEIPPDHMGLGILRFQDVKLTLF